MKRTAILAALAASALGMAQTYVVAPNAYASTATGSGLNTLIRDSGNARTAQLLIGASQLGSISVGQQITGMTFRLWSGATVPFPATAATWTDYTVNMGVGVNPNAASTTFASNFVGSATTVRSGALTIPANSFSSGASGTTPNNWGFEITFNNPYTYTGGNLLIEVRHTGSNIVNNASSDFLDCVLTTGSGFGTDFWAATATGNTATTGAANSFTITRLTVAPVPEPATLACLGLGAAALLRRRRQR